MNARILTLAGIVLAAVVALAALGPWRSSEAIGPDVDDDGTVTILDILQVARAFGQDVPTPTPTATPPSTPSPTPTRIPGMLDVEVNLSVSENYHITDDR